MASRSAKHGRQHGLTLLELVVALSLGSLVILAASQLLVSTISSASLIRGSVEVQEKLLELQLLLTKELRRAGYHSQPNHSATFSDQTSSLYVNSAHNDMGMVYQVQESGPQAFRNLYFDYLPADKQLKLCDKYSSQPLSSSQAATSSFGSSCYALLDANQFRLTHFQVVRQRLVSATHSSAMVGIDMTLALAADPQIKHSASFKVKQRNWQ